MATKAAAFHSLLAPVDNRLEATKLKVIKILRSITMTPSLQLNIRKLIALRHPRCLVKNLSKTMWLSVSAN